MDSFVLNQHNGEIYTNLPIISHFAKHNCISCNAGTLAFVTDRGTVEAFGDSYENSIPDAKKWQGIVSVSVGNYFILGLKDDGTVVGSGHLNYFSNCLTWHNIIDLIVCGSKICGITKSGNVILEGFDNKTTEASKHWSNVIHVAISIDGIIALKNDGSIYCSEFALNNIYSILGFYWIKKDYKEVCLGLKTVYALQNDGKIYKYSYTNEGGGGWWSKELDGDWENIFHISVYGDKIFGIRKDGTVIYDVGTYAKGRNIAFYKQRVALKNLVSIFCNMECFIGVTEEGKLIWSGYDLYGELIPDNNYMPNPDNIDYTFFTLLEVGPFRSTETMLKHCEDVENNYLTKIEAKEQELIRIKEEKAIQEEKKRKELELLRSQYRTLGVCQYCGKKFKGIFTKTCSSCGRRKDY